MARWTLAGSFGYVGGPLLTRRCTLARHRLAADPPRPRVGGTAVGGSPLAVCRCPQLGRIGRVRCLAPGVRGAPPSRRSPAARHARGRRPAARRLPRLSRALLRRRGADRRRSRRSRRGGLDRSGPGRGCALLWILRRMRGGRVPARHRSRRTRRLSGVPARAGFAAKLALAAILGSAQLRLVRDPAGRALRHATTGEAARPSPSVASAVSSAPASRSRSASSPARQVWRPTMWILLLAPVVLLVLVRRD